MLLNHDCYMYPGSIGILMRYIKNNPNSVIAPVQYILSSGREIVGATSCFLLGFPTIIPPPAWYRLRYSSALVPVRLIMGGRGVILTADTFHRIGYLDEEHMPHYNADHDFYFRCRKAGLRLLVCREAMVYVDNTMTTSAEMSSRMSLSQFTTSLKERGSHRNIWDMHTLFKRYYPIPRFAPLGVALNILRYFSVYLVKTLVPAIRRNHRLR
jgi:GT2 family glycosyltransferase